MADKKSNGKVVKLAGLILAATLATGGVIRTNVVDHREIRKDFALDDDKITNKLEGKIDTITLTVNKMSLEQNSMSKDIGFLSRNIEEALKK